MLSFHRILLLAYPFLHMGTWGGSTLDIQVNTGVQHMTAVATIASLKALTLKGNGAKSVPGFASKLTNLE